MPTISSKGQVTVPKAFREKLGLRSGTRLEFSLEGGKLVMKKVVEKDPFENWIGQAKSRFRTTTDQIVEDLRGGPPEEWIVPISKHKKKS